MSAARSGQSARSFLPGFTTTTLSPSTVLAGTVASPEELLNVMNLLTAHGGAPIDIWITGETTSPDPATPGFDRPRENSRRAQKGARASTKGVTMLGARNRWSTACRLAGAMLAIGLLAAACSSGSTSTTSAKASSAASAASTKVSSAASAASSKGSSAGSAVSSAVAAAVGPATVGTTTGTLGTFLVDGKGMTLYMYLSDTAGESTCYDACAVAWPPLLTNGARVVTGG